MATTARDGDGGEDVTASASTTDGDSSEGSSHGDAPRDPGEAWDEEEEDYDQRDEDDEEYDCDDCDGYCEGCAGAEGDASVGDSEGETMDGAWWDERFRQDIEQDTVSEWLMSYTGLAHFMTPHLDPSRRTLVVGCGNSDFSAQLCAKDGFKDVVNTDVSRVVVEHMRKKHRDNDSMTWVVDDATNSSFPNASFDQIVDKSLLDCLCHCADTRGCVPAFVRECHRLLKPGGVAVFATDRTQSQLERRFDCAGRHETRWLGLGWDVRRRVVFAPIDAAAGGIRTEAVAVDDPAKLPKVGGGSVGICFIIVARKEGGTRERPHADRAIENSKRTKLV